MTKATAIIEIANPKKSPALQYQRELFPVEIIDLYPNDQGSADLSLIGTGRNNKDYAIKRVCDGNNMIPATELFCYELARRVNIATPEFDIVMLKDGELAFGSVWEGGVYRISGVNEAAKILTGATKVKALDQFFGKVYAFDLFINNIDRHFGNFLFRQSYNSCIALAFDYSRAWYEIDFAGLQAIDKQCKTQMVINIIKKFGRFDRQQSEKTLDELSQIEPSTIEQILSEIPESWMTKKQSNGIIAWWNTQHFKDRLLTLKKEITNDLV
ncbi:HipA family kinase [Methylobacter marinus]|uniref:HipA family kinase n=1 Tax=Methylobacter marinus TaxID=34058 RepID=UPI00036D65CF|nr:HipA family kinase [Methylobacter marinus]